MKSVSMDDIAEKVGISKSLVSRALADKYGVSDKMRNEIKTTAIKMGYKFKGKKTQSNIGNKPESVTVVIEKTNLLDSWFFLKILNSIENELYKNNISVFLTVIENDNVEKIPLSVKQMKTDGVIIIGSVDLERIGQIATIGLPAVMVDSTYGNLKIDHVLVNNYWGAYDVGELLIKKGHRNISFFGSVKYSYSFSERYRGFVDCISQQSELITTHNIIEMHDSFYVPFCREKAFELLNSEDRPSAIFCANDRIALQVYDMAMKIGLQVPEDLSLVGFDNIQKNNEDVPALTTVNIPKSFLGQCAVNLLLNKIKQPNNNFQVIMVGTEFVEGETLQDKMLTK